jgi:acyl-CoA dehydrogenase
VALEELGAVNAAYANLIGASVGLFGNAVNLDGTEEQKERYLRPIAEGRAQASFCLTEPMSGSDAASLRTTATRRDGGWVLNGSKQWATNSPIADSFVVFAANDLSKRSRGGITAFIVEKGAPGLKVGKPDKKMGLRGSYTAPVMLDDVYVPDAQVLGEVGQGFKTALKTLERGRIGISAGAVGTAQWLLKRSLAYAKQRQQFGQPIRSFQGIQWMLADMEVGIHAGRLMVYHGAWKIDSGQRASHESAICKLYCSEMLGKVADLAVQIHGGMGYMKELPIERAYRDARILRIYEGTSEVQRMLIAENLLRQT